MKPASRIMAMGVLCLATTLPGFAQAAKHAVKSADKAQIAHGEYIVNDVILCSDCHTPRNDKGEPLPGEWLKGAKVPFRPLVPLPVWADTAPGIAGLDGWDTEKAIKFLMTGLDPSGHRARPPMPQLRMSRTDAAAVVAYLKSLK